MSLIAFSQKDTATPVKCFTIPLVKEITKDLLSGDSAKALLKLTQDQLQKTEEKVDLKDSIITKMQEKEGNYISIINGERSKYEILETHTKKVQKDLKWTKVKYKFTKIALIGAIAVLSFLAITK